MYVGHFGTYCGKTAFVSDLGWLFVYQYFTMSEILAVTLQYFYFSCRCFVSAEPPILAGTCAWTTHWYYAFSQGNIFHS